MTTRAGKTTDNDHDYKAQTLEPVDTGTSRQKYVSVHANSKTFLGQQQRNMLNEPSDAHMNKLSRADLSRLEELQQNLHIMTKQKTYNADLGDIRGTKWQVKTANATPNVAPVKRTYNASLPGGISGNQTRNR